ncbi:psbP domain-containing protein 2, chloroplastic-like [Vicia villosa]|uniref:psbP domain-containing protein 2, chloroplastic-like n=1 Tax=Vicia villosa TaxID=3911 RepID=UPI00273A9181|nr:psbP domain-containing protein 2, chloroplastic-like [Vicia villosa]
MALKSLSTLSHTTTLFHKLTHASPSSPILTPKSSSSIYIHHSCLSKRKLILLSPFLWSVLPNTLLLAQELLTDDLQRFTDSKEGFTLLTPSSWTKVDKAGATVLFQDPNTGSNNIGVVVNPVRLSTLPDFGTPQFVADKLLQAERRKESTNEAEVITVEERSGKGGLQVYEFEYKIDSTRGGIKRIFTAAFVASRKLYLLNIVHSDNPESPLDPDKRLMLEQVLHSFDSSS